jgi:hypothetical protein
MAGVPLAADGRTPAASQLREACAEYVRLENKRVALFDHVPDDDARAPLHAALSAQQEPFFERIIALRAVSAEDHRARAEAAAAMCDGEIFDHLGEGCWDRMIVAALVRDMVQDRAEPVAPVGVASDRDAGILRDYAEAMRLRGLWEISDEFDDAWFAVADKVASTPAMTNAGRLAKAVMIRDLMEPMQDRWASGDTHDRTSHDPLVWSLVNDLLGYSAA